MTQDAATELSFHVITEKDVEMRTRDGVRLNADVYRPDAPGTCPVLLMRTSYDKTVATAMDILDPAAFVSRGYIVVVQDTRGRGSSDGEWYPSIYEALDTYDSVEWAATLPGSNGKVGMAGQSYHGLTQYLGAAMRPPHL